jgi:hypothetical protein
MDLSMEVRTRWQDNIYPLCSCVEFLEGEQGDTQTPIEWNKHKNLPPQMDVKQLTIKNHLGHTWYNITT